MTRARQAQPNIQIKMAYTTPLPNNPNFHPTNCTLSTCPLTWAYLMYDPTLAGNVFFLSIYILLFPIQLFLGIRYRTLGVTIAMLIGLALEIIGYTGRVLMHYNPFLKTNFLTYLIPLTIGPVFLAAALYLCLSRIVVVYITEKETSFSLLKPRTYTLLFIGCDIVSLVLQAVGGAIAAIADDRAKIRKGSNIMVGGLSAQVASLLLFMGLSLEFGHRCWIHQDQLNPKHARLYSSRHFKVFLASLALATICIFVRSVFRVAELSAGFGGKLANDEVTYMILEGAMIVIASVTLTIMHPGIGFGKVAWEEGDWHFRDHQEKNFQKGGFPMTREEI